MTNAEKTGMIYTSLKKKLLNISEKNTMSYSIPIISSPLKSNHIFIQADECTKESDLILYCGGVGRLYRLDPNHKNCYLPISYKEYRKYKYL